MAEIGTVAVGDEWISVDDVRNHTHVVIGCCPDGCVVMPDDDTDVALAPYQMIALANWLVYHADKILKGDLT